MKEVHLAVVLLSNDDCRTVAVCKTIELAEKEGKAYAKEYKDAECFVETWKVKK